MKVAEIAYTVDADYKDDSKEILKVLQLEEEDDDDEEDQMSIEINAVPELKFSRPSELFKYNLHTYVTACAYL